MASWMIHLRIADKLLDKIPDLSPIEFIMGNMAPDSGVPVEGGYEPKLSAPYFGLAGTYSMEIDRIIRSAMEELNGNK